MANVEDRFSVISDVNDVSGSQGVFGLTNDKITVDVQITGGKDLDHDPTQINNQRNSDDGDREQMTYGNGKPHLPSHKDLPSNSSGKGSGAPQTNSGQGKTIGGTVVTSNSVELTTSVG